MHLKEKTFIRKEGETAHLKRRYDVPQTPCDRLSATDAISDEDRDKLQSLRDQTNPRRLRQDIYQAIDDLFALPGATPGVTEDIYQTLSTLIPPQKGEDTLVTLSFDLTRTHSIWRMASSEISLEIGTLLHRSHPCQGDHRYGIIVM